MSLTQELQEKELATELDKIEEALKEAKLEECRQNQEAFSSYVMQDELGKRWRIARHQREWFELLESGYPRILVIAPRASAKSTSVMSWLIRQIGLNPNLITKYVCGDDNLAIAKLGFMRRNMLHNPRYKEVFPHIQVSPAKEDEDTKHKLTVERSLGLGLQDPTIEAFSVLSTGTGGRAHIIIFDDIIDPRLAVDSPSMLPKVQYRVEHDWLNLLYPGGRAIMIGSYWSFNPPDIYVNYSRNPRWKLWRKPACYRAPDGSLKGPVLWPEVWPLERLEDRLKDGEAAFRQQFLLEGVVEARDYFTEEGIQKCLKSDIMLGEGDSEDWPIFIGVDPAASLNRSASFSAISVITVNPSGQKLIKELYRLKDKPEVIARVILNLAIKYERRLKLILVENNAYQEALVSLIKVLAEAQGVAAENVPIMGRFTGSNKWSLDTGLPCLAAEMVSGKWIFPFKGDHKSPGHQCPLCQLVGEMRQFPYGETTDMIMSLLLASAAANQVGRIGDLPVSAIHKRRNLQRWFR